MKRLILIALALVAAVAVARRDNADAYNPLPDDSYFTEGGYFNTHWWQTDTPKAPDISVFRFCVNENSFVGQMTIELASIEYALTSWDFVIEDRWARLVIHRDPDCPQPVGTDFARCYNTLNSVNVLTFASLNGAIGHSCWHVDDGPGAATAGRFYECDMLVDYAENIPPPRSMRGTITHEIGHCLGLGHECSSIYASVMCGDSSSPGFSRYDPTTDDADGIQFIYTDYDADGCTGAEEAWINRSWTPPLGPAVDTNWQDYGDVNHDGAIGAVDLGIESQGLGNYGAGNVPAPYKDYPTNGVINGADLGMIAIQIGHYCLKP